MRHFRMPRGHHLNIAKKSELFFVPRGTFYAFFAPFIVVLQEQTKSLSQKRYKYEEQQRFHTIPPRYRYGSIAVSEHQVPHPYDSIVLLSNNSIKNNNALCCGRRGTSGLYLFSEEAIYSAMHDFLLSYARYAIQQYGCVDLSRLPHSDGSTKGATMRRTNARSNHPLSATRHQPRTILDSRQ